MKKLLLHFIFLFILIINSAFNASVLFAPLKSSINGTACLTDMRIKGSYSINDTPSLIPFPQKIKWSNNVFSLPLCTGIYISSSALVVEAKKLQHLLSTKGFRIPIILNQPKKGVYIELMDEKVMANNKESYTLLVTDKNISIKSEGAHGFFNAIQTLAQLINDKIIRTCDITDWPAFPWRGFMVDVGRNFQSIQQLKKQIDVMASYKLNIFHFHLTEDIAWRLQSKLYPELTAEKNMIRNKGLFYSFDEVRDLINYCNERYITLVPEIDMPGHSAAFKRAMGVDMQSDKGQEICRNILKELCTELNVPMVHIGGDEVDITNKQFLTNMTSLLSSLHKKIIAWNPGGELPEGTMLQMWNGSTTPKDKFLSIDSRHLYLNHFDPIDGVVATFNHIICDVNRSDSTKIGATLCNWPDRRVAREEDLINMNAVYPVMLSFAERCWRGGGWKNYASDIGIPGTEKYNEFVHFEQRLLAHKLKYFTKESFPYVKQSHLEWSLIGPFENGGNTAQKFAPEGIAYFDTALLNQYPKVVGGTIWLRHFWSPMIESHLTQQEDSVTYYAVTRIWANKDGHKNAWIGFNNLSRSTATDSPPTGAWDHKNSAIWVNGKLISPPHWARAGQKGDLEIPLIDEGYEYRPPTTIFLQKGWNTVLVKCPVGSFKAKDWQNQVKWMFTFITL